MKIDFIKMWFQCLKREWNSKMLKPHDSIVFVTYRCTSHCKTCNIWRRAYNRANEFINNELPPEKWIHIIEKLYNAGVSSVEIFGGDALLRKDIVNTIVDQCTQYGITTFFPTNSNLLDEETIESLVLLGLGTLYFSVDGVNELHDHIRGIQGAFLKTSKAIQNICNTWLKHNSTKPRIGILSTISNMNFDKIKQLIEVFQKFPIDFILLRALGEITDDDIEHSAVDGIKPTPFFITTTGESHLLSASQLKVLRQDIHYLRKNKKSLGFYLGLAHIEPLPEETFTKGIFPSYPCYICTTVVTVTPEGGIVPCPFFTDYFLGSIKDNGVSLSSIWGNTKHKRFIALQRSGALRVCRKCSMRHMYPGIKETFRQFFYPYVYRTSY